MVGHSTSRQSIGRDDTLWLAMKDILENHTYDFFEKEGMVKLELELANANSYSGVAASEAAEVMDLYNKGLLDDLDIPLRLGKCSHVEPTSATTIRTWADPNAPPAVAWYTDCGRSFGHELTFSRTLELDLGFGYADTETPFVTVKNSKGGTEIHRHWYPGYGEYWELLKESITGNTLGGTWKGFIWHQGSQETWTSPQDPEDTSLTYLGNLTCLVHQVRAEMFASSPPGSFACKDDIPVVIVQVGFWPSSRAAAQRVRDAQTQFCQQDLKAELVVTDDLSRNYHYDAASFLIAGNRIAEAYRIARDGPSVCPPLTPCINDKNCSAGFTCEKTAVGKGNDRLCQPEPASVVCPNPSAGSSPMHMICYGDRDYCASPDQCCSGRCHNNFCQGN